MKCKFCRAEIYQEGVDWWAVEGKIDPTDGHKWTLPCPYFNFKARHVPETSEERVKKILCAVDTAMV